jgi:hypothetical protein
MHGYADKIINWQTLTGSTWKIQPVKDTKQVCQSQIFIRCSQQLELEWSDIEAKMALELDAYVVAAICRAGKHPICH